MHHSQYIVSYPYGYQVSYYLLLLLCVLGG